MKKSLFIIMILISSLIFVSCANDDQDNIPDNEIAPDLEEEVAEPEEDDQEMTESGFEYSFDNIREFELEIELLDGQEVEYQYMSNGNNRDEAINLLESIEVNLDRSLNEMMDEVLESLDMERGQVKEFELQLEFSDSKEIDFKYKREEGSGNKTVKDYELDVDFWDGSEKEYDDDQGLMDALNISMDSMIGEIADKIFDYLDLNPGDVKEFDLDIDYSDDSEIDVKVHY